VLFYDFLRGAVVSKQPIKVAIDPFVKPYYVKPDYGASFIKSGDIFEQST